MEDNVSEPTPDLTAQAAVDQPGSADAAATPVAPAADPVVTAAEPVGTAADTDAVGTPDAAADLDGTADAPADRSGSAELREHLAGLDDDQRAEYLGELVRAESETILKNPIALDSNFLEKGLNSLTALELAKTLIDRVGNEVPMVAIVENPTPAELGRYLAKEFTAGPDPVA